MEGVGHTSVEVTAVRHNPHARDIEIGLVAVTPELVQQFPNELLRPAVMDKSGFERGNNGNKLLDWQAVLGFSGIERSERFLDHLARELAQRNRTWARGEDKELPVIETLAPQVVIYGGINVQRIHIVVLSTAVKQPRVFKTK